jgi:hypothetical protein
MMALAVFSLSFRQLRAARLLAATLVIAGLWPALSALEMAIPGLSGKIVGNQIRVIPVAFLPVLCTLVTLENTRRLRWLTPFRIAALFFIPIASTILVLSGDPIHLFHLGYHLDPAGMSPFVQYTRGPGTRVLIIYAALLIFGDIVLFFVTAHGSAAVARRQAWLLAIGLLCTLVAGILAMIFPGSQLQGDLTSIAVSVTGILVAVAFFRYRAFDLLPIVNTVLFQAIEDIALVIDVRGRLVGFNEKAGAELGLNQRASPGIGLTQLPSPWDSVLEPYREAGSCKAEVTIPQENRAFDLSVSLLEPPGGGALGRLIVLHETTERRRVEEELRFNRERLQLALDSANEGLWDVLLPDDSFWSPRFYTMLGYAPGELPPGRASWESLLHPDDRAASLSAAMAHLRDDGAPGQFEYRMRTRSGDWRWILCRCSVVERAADGSPVRMVGTHQDITERKEAEAKLRGFIEQATEAIVLVDEDGRIIEFNSSASAMTGYSREAVLGTTAWSFQARILPKEKWRPEIEGQLETTIREAMATGVSSFLNRPITGRILRADGTQIDFEQFAFTISTNRGYQIGTIGHDVTSARQTEEALRQSEEQLRQAQKMEAIGRLAGGVAHDFNNILTVIGGYSAVLREDLPVGSATREGVDAIIKAAGRASTLTKQLLAFSRKQVLEPRVIAPVDLLRNVEGMLGRVIGEDVELSIIADPDAGAIKADPGQVEQVLMNLAVNARDAMPGGGKLLIETGNRVLGADFISAHPMVKPGEYVLIAVTDTGHGMDKDTLARIFEPFFTTKPPGKGTGLGLSMAYGIVKQSGGHIFCESRVGRGSVFTLYFPRVFEQPVALGGSARGSDRQRGSGTILLVEDEAGVRTFVQSVLEKSGYDVLTAADGQEALRTHGRRERPVDLLLTDVVMPRMGGTELAVKLREVWPAVKVLYMSGYAEAVIVRGGVLDPSVAFLRKPFSPRELLEKIREMTSSPPR